MFPPIYNTPISDALCKEVAKRSKGVCFLGFSHGKDSVLAYLQLSRYFKRIIPFHCASVPHLKFVDAILDYYEYELQTKILRLMGEDLAISLKRLIYQDPRDVDSCFEEFGEVEDYNKLDILEYLRKMYNLPRAWCAFGVNASDSQDRRIYCNKTGGMSEINRTFYPTWDWPRSEIVRALKESGLKLAPEYKYAKRSIGGVPCATYNKILKEHFPDDYATYKKWYPLMDLKTRREAILDARHKAALDAAAEANGGKEPTEAAEAEAETVEHPGLFPSFEAPSEPEPNSRPDSGIYIAPINLAEDEDEEE